MKRLLVLLLSLVVAGLPAVEPALLSQLPETTAGALYFDIQKLANAEEFIEWASKSFFATGGEKKDCGVAEVLVFTTSKPDRVNAVLVRVSRKVDVERNLRDHQQTFTAGKLGGKKAVFIKPSPICEELVIAELESDLYLLAGKRRDAEAFLAMKKGIPKLVTAQTAKLALPDAPIWYVDTGLRLPVQSSDPKNKKVRGNIRICFNPLCGDQTGKLRTVVECPDRSCASQMGVLVPMTCGIVCGMLFSEDQALNDRVLSTISPRLQGSDFCIDADLSKALMEDIHNYFKSRDFMQMVQSAVDLANL